MDIVLTGIDVCGALISDGTQSTLLRPSKWLAPDCREDDAAHLFNATQPPDMHANYTNQAIPADPLSALGSHFLEPTLPHCLHPSFKYYPKARQTAACPYDSGLVARVTNLRHFARKPTSGMSEQCHPTALDSRALIQSRFRACNNNRYHPED